MVSLMRFAPLALVLGGAAAAAGTGASSVAIFSTVGHSEWCPAGTAYVDLGTGRYSLMPRAERSVCHKAKLQRRVKQGMLTSAQLSAIRKAYEATQADGLTLQVCRNGGRPTDIVVSNGGRVTLVVSGGTRTEAAPEELGCWTQAAKGLHDTLERTFGYAH
jgi:hypothetical protein